jgi:acetyltransferase-like isoleucine patch superfamily enzyme
MGRLWSIYAKLGMYRCIRQLRERIGYRVRGQFVLYVVGLRGCGDRLRVGRRVILSNPNIKLGNSVTVDSGSSLLGRGVIEIGDSAVLNRGTEIDAALRVTIGARTLIGPYCYFVDSNHLAPKPGSPLESEPGEAAPINVGRDVWLGKGVIVLSGVTIGDGAVVGAGSVVTRSIPSGEVWAGVPARRIHAITDRVGLDPPSGVGMARAQTPLAEGTNRHGLGGEPK